MTNFVVYDIETFQNLFTYVDKNRDTKEYSKFVVHRTKDDRIALFKHLKSDLFQIGFSNLNFDYPVIFWMLQNESYLMNVSPEEFCRLVYNKAQEIIKADYTTINSWDENKLGIRIPQLDLYVINHFDNGAKRTSLKDLEFYMRMKKIQDLPYHHEDIISDEGVQIVLDYNTHDVNATYDFYLLNVDAIKMRVELSNYFSLDFLNANDPKIGVEIFLKYISEITNIGKKELEKMRTHRKEVLMSEIIFDYVKFQSQVFYDFLTNLKTKIITDTDTFSERIVYKEFPFDFGVGGIHGCIASGIYRPKDDEKIMSSDVVSYYPNLSIKNGLFPEHLGKIFCDVYNEIFIIRQEAKKNGVKSKDAGLKLALNGVYGKSGSEYSAFFDKKFMYSITINGQLLLVSLAERLMNEGFKPLMINTDGFEFVVPKSKENVYLDICKQWEKETKLTLEHDDYSVIAISNVNNYIAQTSSGAIKKKGLYETKKAYHKDVSFMIVPIALEKYILEGIPVEQTIQNHKDIFDFCGRVKSNSGYKIHYHYLDGYEEKKIKLQKINRVFISNKGGYLYKSNGKRTEAVYSKKKVTLFNNYFDDDYEINYQWYINECYKIINELEPKQLTLF